MKQRQRKRGGKIEKESCKTPRFVFVESIFIHFYIYLPHCDIYIYIQHGITSFGKRIRLYVSVLFRETLVTRREQVGASDCQNSHVNEGMEREGEGRTRSSDVERLIGGARD